MKHSLLKIGDKYLNLDLDTQEFSISTEKKRAEMPRIDRQFFPEKVVMMMGDRCNLECTYCFADAGGDLSLDWPSLKAFIEFLSKTASPGVQIALSGGEPTLNKNLLKTIDYCKAHLVDPSIVLVTNGIIDKDLLEKLINRDLVFHVSFEGLADVNDEERPFPDGSGSSRKVLATLKRLLEWDSDKVIVRLNVSRPKVGREKEIAEYFSKLGIHRVELGWMHATGRGADYEGVLSRDAEEMSRFYDAFRDCGICDLKTMVDDVASRPVCGAGFRTFGLTADGFLVGCDAFNRMEGNEFSREPEKYCFGRVAPEGVEFDEKALEEVQNRFLRVPEECRRCGLLPVCKPCPLKLIRGGFNEEYCTYLKADYIRTLRRLHESYFKSGEPVKVCENP